MRSHWWLVELHSFGALFLVLVIQSHRLHPFKPSSFYSFISKTTETCKKKRRSLEKTFNIIRKKKKNLSSFISLYRCNWTCLHCPLLVRTVRLVSVNAHFIEQYSTIGLKRCFLKGPDTQCDDSISDGSNLTEI